MNYWKKPWKIWKQYHTALWSFPGLFRVSKEQKTTARTFSCPKSSIVLVIKSRRSSYYSFLWSKSLFGNIVSWVCSINISVDNLSRGRVFNTWNFNFALRIGKLVGGKCQKLQLKLTVLKSQTRLFVWCFPSRPDTKGFHLLNWIRLKCTWLSSLH